MYVQCCASQCLLAVDIDIPCVGHVDTSVWCVVTSATDWTAPWCRHCYAILVGFTRASFCLFAFWNSVCPCDLTFQLCHRRSSTVIRRLVSKRWQLTAMYWSFSAACEVHSFWRVVSETSNIMASLSYPELYNICRDFIYLHYAHCLWWPSG